MTEKKKLWGVIIIIALIIILLFILGLIKGVLDGVSNTLAEIPKWLRIILFVSISLIAAGLFRNKEK